MMHFLEFIWHIVMAIIHAFVSFIEMIFKELF